MTKVQTILQTQRAYFDTGATRPLAFRKGALARLKKAVSQYEGDILDALRQDLGKAPTEAFACEVGLVHDEINYMLRHLDAMARPQKVPTPIAHFPAWSSIHPQPYGLVLIMSPWNYPFLLTVTPLIGAIAAGNCAMVKPSAYTPATSALLARMLGSIFPARYVAVVEGGREVNAHLLENAFDYIFFTGSVAVGKTVMAAAAQNLTPVTLELGGKSPVIVDETAKIPLAARRIVWGKFINAGQTCVAPDYVLCHHKVQEELLHWLEYYIGQSYGPAPLQSGDLPRIVNQKHFDRLTGLLGDGETVCGGAFDESSLKIEPTVLRDITGEDNIMQEEVFGPILPVLPYQSLRQAMDFVAARPHPLALYCFSESGVRQRRIMEGLTFGGGCVNDTVVHLATPHMPFGGVGQSGMGGYHGQASFNTFSHHKSVLQKCSIIDVPLRYPPYRDWALKVMKLVFR